MNKFKLSLLLPFAALIFWATSSHPLATLLPDTASGTTSEPATYALGGVGFTILFLIRRRRMRKAGHWPL